MGERKREQERERERQADKQIETCTDRHAGKERRRR